MVLVWLVIAEAIQSLVTQHSLSRHIPSSHATPSEHRLFPKLSVAPRWGPRSDTCCRKRRGEKRHQGHSQDSRDVESFELLSVAMRGQAREAVEGGGELALVGEAAG